MPRSHEEVLALLHRESHAHPFSAKDVAEDAAQRALSLPEMSDDVLRKSLLCHLSVDEPAIHMQPWHFLPTERAHTVDAVKLHELAVAGKLDYVRYRWLDEAADKVALNKAVPLNMHRLNLALLNLIRATYERSLPQEVHATFFPTLAELYARHALSLVLDGGNLRPGGRELTIEDYRQHAEARHGPMRSSLDAVLLLVGFDHRELERVRTAWHHWAFGLQLHDDIVDIEEDLRAGKFTWFVSQTLRAIPGLSSNDVDLVPEAADVYETALIEGTLLDGVAHARTCFEKAAELTREDFPTWAAYQETKVEHMRSLGTELESISREVQMI